MNKKENQRITLTKRLLKESLIELMAKKSIEKISITELCQTAGINRTTFYNHYGNQFDVLRDIEIEVASDLEKIWQEKSKKSDWTLIKRVEILCSYFQKNKKLSKLLFKNNNSDSEFATLLFNTPHVESIYERLFTDEKDELNKDLMTTFSTHGAYSMIKKWILEDIKKTPKEMGELVYSMTIYMGKCPK
ncbi:MAG: TetR/AcrR family transcriptional regulator [Lachnospirales bacterium]